MTFTLPPAVTEGGVLQIYAEEKGIMVGAWAEEYVIEDQENMFVTNLSKQCVCDRPVKAMCL